MSDADNESLPVASEHWYCFKEVGFDSDGTTRLFTPRRNPREYEYPVDYLFPSPKEAYEHIHNGLESEMYTAEEVNDWFLCEEITDPIVRINVKV